MNFEGKSERLAKATRKVTFGEVFLRFRAIRNSRTTKTKANSTMTLRTAALCYTTVLGGLFCTIARRHVCAQRCSHFACRPVHKPLVSRVQKPASRKPYSQNIFYNTQNKPLNCGSSTVGLCLCQHDRFGNFVPFSQLQVRSTFENAGIACNSGGLVGHPFSLWFSLMFMGRNSQTVLQFTEMSVFRSSCLLQARHWIQLDLVLLLLQ